MLSGSRHPLGDWSLSTACSALAHFPWNLGVPRTLVSAEGVFGTVFGVPGVFGSGFTVVFGSVRQGRQMFAQCKPRTLVLNSAAPRYEGDLRLLEPRAARRSAGGTCTQSQLPPRCLNRSRCLYLLGEDVSVRRFGVAGPSKFHFEQCNIESPKQAY